MAENTIYDRGMGNWSFRLYNPEEIISGYVGRLQITKDFHVVIDKDGVTLVSVPCQNIAYVENLNYKK